MHKFYLLITVFLIVSCQTKKKEGPDDSQKKLEEQSEIRWVKDNIITSNELPKIEIVVNEEFNYLGKFDFEIIANSNEYSEDMQGKPIAAGERYVFATSDKKLDVTKLFIVQFEGFLPENNLIYNYNFENADFIGDNKYRHNTWYYNTKKSMEENPKGEWAKTISFLMDKGFRLEDDVMMSRFVGLASKDRKNEIIIFYHEMLKKTTGYSLEEYEKSLSDEEAASIRNLFVERSRKSFSITKG